METWSTERVKELTLKRITAKNKTHAKMRRYLPVTVAAMILLFCTITVGAYGLMQSFAQTKALGWGATPKAEADIEHLRENAEDFVLFEEFIIAGMSIIVFTYDFTPDLPNEAVSLDIIIKNIMNVMDTEYGIDAASLDNVFFYANYFENFMCQWSIFLRDAETELFYFIVDAITGEVEYSAQNTPETPFLG